MRYPLLHRRVHQRLLQGKLPVQQIYRCIHDLAQNKHLDRYGLRIKKLKGIGLPVFEVRVNQDIRLIFTMQISPTYQGDSSSPDRHLKTWDEHIAIWDVDHHDEALRRARRIDYQAVHQLEGISLSSSLHQAGVEEDVEIQNLPYYAAVPFAALQQNPHSGSFLQHYTQQSVNEDWWFDARLQQEPTSRAATPEWSDSHEWFELALSDIETAIENWQHAQRDAYLHLTPEQQQWVVNDGPLLLGGAVGSGKTTILLYHLLRQALLNPHGEYLLLSHSPSLIACCHRIFSRLPHAEKVQKRVAIMDYTVWLQSIAQPNTPIMSYDDCRNAFDKFYTDLKFRWRRKAIPQEAKSLLEPYPELPWSREDLWSEFWHTLRGGMDFHSKQPMELEFYLRCHSPIPNSQREGVHALQEEFFRHIHEQDELSVSRKLWASVANGGTVLPRYDGVYVDEVQDLCEIQWMLFLKMVRHVSGLIWTGDPFQALRPSGSFWPRLQARLGEQVPLRNHWLSLNMRNSAQIATFVQLNLKSWSREWKLEKPNYNMVSKLQGAPCLVTRWRDERWTDVVSWLQRGGVVIVWDSSVREDTRVQAFQVEGIPVLTVQESKGLEFDRVLLLDLHRVLQNSLEPGIALNQLYVAMTRARRGLLIIEPDRYTPYWQRTPQTLTEAQEADWFALWTDIPLEPNVCAEVCAISLHEKNMEWEELAPFYEKKQQ